MPINDKFLAAREQEMRNRYMAHLKLAHPIELRMLPDGDRATTRMIPLTERHRVEMRFIRNAFFTGTAPLLGDVFLFLWRLNPDFCRPTPARAWAVRELVRKSFHFQRLWFALGTWRSAAAHRRLTRLVRRCDLFAAEEAIYAWLGIAEQDAPGVPTDEPLRASRIKPQSCYPDHLVEYCTHKYNMSPTAILDAPCALLYQLYRAHILSLPDGELEVFAPSDRLLSDLP